VHAIIEQHRDNLGIAFPESVRPFDSSVILLDANQKQQRDLAEKCYETLLAIEARPLFDDRAGKTLKEKASLADFYGIPFKFIVGRLEVDRGTVMVKRRDGREEEILLDPEVFLKVFNNK
jgi:prolyl-tRNA synthetase